MEIKSFEEILKFICDVFDNSIAPLRLSRTNTNAIYLILKAVAKGFEVINNTCVQLKNKFNPELCDDYDLESVAKLVGTSMLQGKQSGLRIEVSATDTEAVLLAGDYKYQFTDDVFFKWTVESDTTITPGVITNFFALSNKKEAIRVQSTSKLSVTGVKGQAIPANITFDCQDNVFIQGYADETPLEFRKRILTDTTRQDSLKELEIKLRNLPMIFDCKLIFNKTEDPVIFDETYTIKPFNLLILANGQPDKSFAELIVENTIYPLVSQTTAGEALKFVNYNSDIFTDGFYKVYYAEFAKETYGLKIQYTFDSTLITDTAIRALIEEAVKPFRNPSEHKKYILEDTFYNIINELNMPSVTLINININNSAGSPVEYLEIPSTKLAVLDTIDYAPQQ